MPNMRNQSVDKNHMFLEGYCKFNDDYSDLSDKIEYLIKDDTYKRYAENGYNSYNNYHNIDKCCEYYYNSVMKFAKV
jgi:glycosyltransferase involved in cell wall biosynthesis